jgi:hypothetical protein
VLSVATMGQMHFITAIQRNRHQKKSMSRSAPLLGTRMIVFEQASPSRQYAICRGRSVS